MSSLNSKNSRFAGYRGLLKGKSWQLMGRCCLLLLEIIATSLFLVAFAPLILLMHTVSWLHKWFGSPAPVHRSESDWKVVIGRNGRVLHVRELAPRDEEIERLLRRIANEGRLMSRD